MCKTFSLEHPGNTDSNGVSLGQAYLIVWTMEDLFEKVIVPAGVASEQKLLKQKKSSNSKSLLLSI